MKEEEYVLVFTPCAENDPNRCGGYSSDDGYSLCYVREMYVPKGESGPADLKANGEKPIPEWVSDESPNIPDLSKIDDKEKPEPKYYTDDELRNIISMVCDQLNEGFNGREGFIDQTIAAFAGRKAAIEELRKMGVKHPNPHLCDNKNNCGYPGCECLPF